MLFQNLTFMLLCAVTFVVYWRFPVIRLWILALANAVFYLAAGWQNLALFLGVSAVTYGLGRVVTGPYGRAVLWAGIGLNVANLALFKYAGFVTATLHPWLALPWLDPALVKDVLLPIGISFYTFQHISYLVDRRQRDLPAAPNYLHFWVYISFFGHSIAGPIMRGHEFLPQIAETTRKRLDWTQVRYGLALFVLGLSKKVMIADPLAGLCDPLFANATMLSGGESWVAALLFAFQIYFDFSAYSDMAVGIGHMFGYSLTQNFRTPYVAANAREFWSRWHITLSHWIRDYIYIPLGGNRAGLARGQLNMALAMLVSGLWHGAAWTFVVWGAAHGLLLLGLRAWEAAKTRLAWAWFSGRSYRVLATGTFFALITMTWVLFRLHDLDEAAVVLWRMADPTQWASLWGVKRLLLLCAGLYGLHWLEFLAREHEVSLGAAWRARVPATLRGLAYAGVALTLLGLHGGSQDFIYFKF